MENRVRLFREVLEDTKDAVGHRCAVAVRFAVDELLGSNGITSENEVREVVETVSYPPLTKPTIDACESWVCACYIKKTQTHLRIPPIIGD